MIRWDDASSTRISQTTTLHYLQSSKNTFTPRDGKVLASAPLSFCSSGYRRSISLLRATCHTLAAAGAAHRSVRGAARRRRLAMGRAARPSSGASGEVKCTLGDAKQESFESFSSLDDVFEDVMERTLTFHGHLNVVSTKSLQRLWSRTHPLVDLKQSCCNIAVPTVSIGKNFKIGVGYCSWAWDPR